jgi:hypothetical protein
VHQQPATGRIDAILDFWAHPATRSVIIKTAHRLLAYPAATGGLEFCDGELAATTQPDSGSQ